MCAYSPYVSTALQVSLRETGDEAKFRLDEHAFFDHVYLMTVNLTTLTSSNIADLVRLVQQVSETSNWADTHFALGCYQTYKLLKDGSYRRIFGSNFAVVAFLGRDF